MINEDAPTNSVGTGGFSSSSAATGPVAGYDPVMCGGKKKKRKKRYYTKEDLDQYNKVPFEVLIPEYDIFYIFYGHSVSDVHYRLRRLYRPEMFNKLKIKRLYKSQVSDFYWEKRQKSLRPR